MGNRCLRLDPRDNVWIALADLRQGETIDAGGEPPSSPTADFGEPGTFTLASDVPAKHKFAGSDLGPGSPVRMYGILVGQTTQAIRRGEVLSTRNVRHEAAEFRVSSSSFSWSPPEVLKWHERRFLGYRRSDGQTGTRNYWLVAPLVFCENRNIQVLEQSFQEELGFSAPPEYRHHVARLARWYREGMAGSLDEPEAGGAFPARAPKLFENVDGIKFLTHAGGCGGTREDADNLCGLIAGYLHHPNVAGGTVLSLGCQHAQITLLRDRLRDRNPGFDKPLLIFEQQKSQSESAMLSQAVRKTFLALVEANRARREPAELAELRLGLKCGGSDGFSGISANPAIGHTADLIAALGGCAILGEFPELCGVEQELIDRTTSTRVAERFVTLMRDYASRARAVRSSFDMNPSPGNIRDGLLTDAMKSAGAVKKGGTSPVTAVLDYPEYAVTPGLNLLCTPGHDVECVTAQVGAGANVVLFTTGLGTPTGNPIAPVIKISSNSDLARRMSYAIDFDAGPILAGDSTIERMGEAILELTIQVASGERQTRAEVLGQDDFLPWKRGVSL